MLKKLVQLSIWPFIHLLRLAGQESDIPSQETVKCYPLPQLASGHDQGLRVLLYLSVPFIINLLRCQEIGMDRPVSINILRAKMPHVLPPLHSGAVTLNSGVRLTVFP